MSIRPLLLLLALPALLAASSVPDAASQLIDDVRILSADDMAGRLVGTPGSDKARAYLIDRLKTIGVEPVYPGYVQPFETKGRDGTFFSGRNLVARIRGKGKSDRVLVIGAHYDHVGTRGGHVFNGADDNASGVAAVLALATELKQQPPQHDVIIALWDAEESGLLGARAFVANPPLPLARIAMNLNLDMVARGDKGELWLAGAGRHPVLKPWFDRLAKGAPVTLKLGHDTSAWKGSEDWTFSSDHGAFHAAGIPFAYFGVEDHPDVHKATDDFDKIPLDFFKRASATTLIAARLFDRDLDVIAKAAGRTGR